MLAHKPQAVARTYTNGQKLACTAEARGMAKGRRSCCARELICRQQYPSVEWIRDVETRYSTVFESAGSNKCTFCRIVEEAGSADSRILYQVGAELLLCKDLKVPLPVLPASCCTLSTVTSSQQCCSH
jgi:hypothetical protein